VTRGDAWSGSSTGACGKHSCNQQDRADYNVERADRMASSVFALNHREGSSTYFRDTLVFVAETQNITLCLPKELLKRIKRVAADRDTSVSALMTEALGRLADEDRRYSAARKRALSALKSARSLGTQGRRTWSRDELHER